MKNAVIVLFGVAIGIPVFLGWYKLIFSDNGNPLMFIGGFLFGIIFMIILMKTYNKWKNLLDK